MSKQYSKNNYYNLMYKSMSQGLLKVPCKKKKNPVEYRTQCR